MLINSIQIWQFCQVLIHEKLKCLIRFTGYATPNMLHRPSTSTLIRDTILECNNPYYKLFYLLQKITGINY